MEARVLADAVSAMAGYCRLGGAATMVEVVRRPAAALHGLAVEVGLIRIGCGPLGGCPRAGL